jgi:hypothetical protein
VTDHPALTLADTQPALPFTAAHWEHDGADVEPGWWWGGDGHERRIVETRPL